ncbi:distal membrane-arm assembly complex protein 2-like isoform X2 [Homarus americanus]|uniref:distal membrane-arm assembly complex protein 2-like isoform X2 n=1 Tax=Homarus americanus TaxID=6706 RepID=UPI001C467429|nr:distal membrane-arm assembly complex protein 2-like isoform X2 [Homarus americanus]
MILLCADVRMMLCQLKQVQKISPNYGLLNSRNLSVSSTFGTDKGSSHKKLWYVPEEEKRESWNAPTERELMPKKEWRGIFHHFVPSTGLNLNLIHALQKGIDLRPSAIKEWYKNLRQKINVADQSFKEDRVAVLGFDLAAAHFLVHRGGKVRFKNATIWNQKDENEEYELSRHYIPNIFVEEIDASGVDLIYEGLESMRNLQHLKWLSVANCSNIDDWCIDRICCQYSNSLEHLDISNCPKVTERGITALARLRRLQNLQLNGLDGIKNIKLLCLLLEDVLPNLQIEGIQYMDSKQEQQT